MKTICACILLIALISLTTAYGAATTTSQATIKGKGGSSHLIKNSELRANIGSMSKLSLSANLKYSGASIEDPFGEERPNPNGWGGDWSTRLSGSFSGRYRVNKMQSVTTGVGVSATKPFHGMDNGEWKNPFIRYSYAQRFSYLSGYLSTGLTKYTQSSDKRLGKNMNAYAGYTVKWTRIMQTGLTLGMKVDGSATAFNRGYIRSIDRKTSDYYFNVVPMVEYRFSPMFTFKTDLSLGYSHYRHFEQRSKFNRNKLYQRFGLGTAFTPEVYLYTYLSTYPENYRSDATTLSMSLTMSIL
jgi:hypothetical protein